MSLKAKYDEAFYENQKNKSRESALCVLRAVAPALGEVRSIIDIGCGAGGWLAATTEIFPDVDVMGVDHPDVPRETLFIDAARFEGRDLSAPIDLARKFDLAISLEVAEHIAPENADLFIENLTRHADIILFSAALPRQGGTGHVNEQWPDYWTEKFAARGFDRHDIVRPLIWDAPEAAFWYKQNAMIYARNGVARTDGFVDWGGRALVHPDCWMKKTEPLPSKLARLMRGEKPAN